MFVPDAEHWPALLSAGLPEPALRPETFQAHLSRLAPVHTALRLSRHVL